MTFTAAITRDIHSSYYACKHTQYQNHVYTSLWWHEYYEPIIVQGQKMLAVHWIKYSSMELIMKWDTLITELVGEIETNPLTIIHSSPWHRLQSPPSDPSSCTHVPWRRWRGTTHCLRGHCHATRCHRSCPVSRWHLPPWSWVHRPPRQHDPTPRLHTSGTSVSHRLNPMSGGGERVWEVWWGSVGSVGREGVWGEDRWEVYIWLGASVFTYWGLITTGCVHSNGPLKWYTHVHYIHKPTETKPGHPHHISRSWHNTTCAVQGVQD